MQSRYLLSTLLLVCSAATSADNAGWQNARTPQTTNSASDHVQNASQNTGGVPATLVKGELPAPGQASPLVQDAARLDSELSADEIRSLRSLMADNERAINAPITSVVPRISSLTVNLSPGASLPLVRTAMNNLSVVTFTDINGSPWPQSDPPYNAAPKLFDVQYNENMVTITPLRPWASGNISVYLKGLSVPVILNVTSGETDTPSSSQEMDSRLDLRIPRQGPTSPVVSIPTDKIALHDATLQAFLDGIPPRDPSVKRLKFTGNVPDTTIWQHGDDLLVRSRAILRDEFEQTLSSADGTHLIAVDLNNVAGDKTPAGRLKTGIMYLLAGQIAGGDFTLPQYRDEVLKQLPREYHEIALKRINQLDQEVKTKVYDELHNARGIDFIWENLDTQEREQRKFAIRTVLSTQYLRDYPESVLKSANTLWLLRYKPEDIPVLRDNFNVPEFMLKRFLKMPEGPAPDGSGVPVLGVFRVKSGTLARILKFTVGPLELWALNSSPKDSALRKTLTNKLGSVRARKILAENFPRGSATSLIEHRAGQHNSDNVIEELASELIRKQGYNL
ncbi:TPA: DotH/IcmK family type IV secretion protein [Escherichia coli]